METVNALFPEVVAESDALVAECLAQPAFTAEWLGGKIEELKKVHERLHGLLPPKPLRSEA
jgi:hypothetical protein